MKRCKEAVEVFKCRHCGRCFQDVGDDHWLECPYCQTQNGHELAVEGVDFKFKEPK